MARRSIPACQAGADIRGAPYRRSNSFAVGNAVGPIAVFAPNPAVDLAPFGRWTLRDKAAQRRSPLRWASLGVSEMLKTIYMLALLIGTGAFGSALAQMPTGAWTTDGKATEDSVLAKNLGSDAHNVARSFSMAAAFVSGVVAEFGDNSVKLGRRGSNSWTEYRLLSRNGVESKFTEIGGRGSVYETLTVTLVGDGNLRIIQGGKEEFLSYVLWKRIDLTAKPGSPKHAGVAEVAWAEAVGRIIDRLNAQPVVPGDAAR